MISTLVVLSISIFFPFLAGIIYWYKQTRRKGTADLASVKEAAHLDLSSYKVLNLVDRRPWVGDAAYKEITFTELEKHLTWSHFIRQNSGFTINESQAIIYFKMWFLYEPEPEWLGSAKSA